MVPQIFSSALLERFIRYATVDTQSNQAAADSGIFPSSENQKKFAQILETELKAMGLSGVTLTEDFYLYAYLPASRGLEELPSFGLSAHYDTAHSAPADNVKPKVHPQWTGTPIKLTGGFILDPAQDPELASCIGHTLITSDGTTLLGADDKAGIAGILTMAEYLLGHPEIQHGMIEFLFSPDEETGHGMDRVPLKMLKSRAFYTVDGGTEGEIEAECFNAWRTDITFTGIAAHLGNARGKMINAVAMAATFINLLPARESPETTDGYDGYFCPLEISGGTEQVTVIIYVRDFNLDSMKKRLERIHIMASAVESAFPGGTVAVKEIKQYLNMHEELVKVPYVLERLKAAVRATGYEPQLRPIRGGTDGSRLTEMGIPTPNIFTGGHNYHSRTEWASLEQMTRMTFTLIELARIWAERRD